MVEFSSFRKIPRLTRECVITEKIDGTNASIYIGDDGKFLVGARNGWITPSTDNFGFARWAEENEEELRKLGPGHHFGEWCGKGIQRNYGIPDRRFYLFNTLRWSDERPTCCHVVPVIYRGIFSDREVSDAITLLKMNGSVAFPGFMKPEGVVVYHVAANQYFKKTIERDEEWKGKKAS